MSCFPCASCFWGILNQIEISQLDQHVFSPGVLANLKMNHVLSQKKMQFCLSRAGEHNKKKKCVCARASLCFNVWVRKSECAMCEVLSLQSCGWGVWGVVVRVAVSSVCLKLPWQPNTKKISSP